MCVMQRECSPKVEDQSVEVVSELDCKGAVHGLFVCDPKTCKKLGAKKTASWFIVVPYPMCAHSHIRFPQNCQRTKRDFANYDSLLLQVYPRIIWGASLDISWIICIIWSEKCSVGCTWPLWLFSFRLRPKIAGPESSMLRPRRMTTRSRSSAAPSRPKTPCLNVISWFC